jgi:hypothetical protein
MEKITQDFKEFIETRGLKDISNMTKDIIKEGHNKFIVTNDDLEPAELERLKKIRTFHENDIQRHLDLYWENN